MATEYWLLQPFMSSFRTNKLIVDAIKPVSSSKLQWKATRNNYSLRPRTKIEIFPWGPNSMFEMKLYQTQMKNIYKHTHSKRYVYICTRYCSSL